eukprot:4548601-Pleurochrysis_carterae.AAC.2
MLTRERSSCRSRGKGKQQKQSAKQDGMKWNETAGVMVKGTSMRNHVSKWMGTRSGRARRCAHACMHATGHLGTDATGGAQASVDALLIATITTNLSRLMRVSSRAWRVWRDPLPAACRAPRSPSAAASSAPSARRRSRGTRPSAALARTPARAPNERSARAAGGCIREASARIRRACTSFAHCGEKGA